jgi:hypothetical protein
VSATARRISNDKFGENGAEDNIWIKELRSNRRLEIFHNGKSHNM